MFYTCTPLYTYKVPANQFAQNVTVQNRTQHRDLVVCVNSFVNFNLRHTCCIVRPAFVFNL